MFRAHTRGGAPPQSRSVASALPSALSPCHQRRASCRCWTARLTELETKTGIVFSTHWPPFAVLPLSVLRAVSPPPERNNFSLSDVAGALPPLFAQVLDPCTETSHERDAESVGDTCDTLPPCSASDLTVLEWTSCRQRCPAHPVPRCTPLFATLATCISWARGIIVLILPAKTSISAIVVRFSKASLICKRTLCSCSSARLLQLLD